MTTFGLIVLWVLVVALWLVIIIGWGDKRMTPNRANVLIFTALVLTITAGVDQHAAMTAKDADKSELATESSTDADDDEDPDEYADSDDEETDATDESADESADTEDESTDTTTDATADTDDDSETATESSSTTPVASSSSVVARSSSRSTRYSHTNGTTHNPARAGSNSGTRHYAYKPVPKTGDSQTVYVSANIPGRYHKDPHCRGLEQRGGRVAMTLAQARAKGYVAFCAYERYGN